MNVVAGNTSCPFSRSQGNWWPLQFRVGEIRTGPPPPESPPVANPACHPLRVPAHPKFRQGLLGMSLNPFSHEPGCLVQQNIALLRPSPDMGDVLLWLLSMARTCGDKGVTGRTCCVASRCCHLVWKPLRAEAWLSDSAL